MYEQNERRDPKIFVRYCCVYFLHCQNSTIRVFRREERTAEREVREEGHTNGAREKSLGRRVKGKELTSYYTDARRTTRCNFCKAEIRIYTFSRKILSHHHIDENDTQPKQQSEIVFKRIINLYKVV